MSTPTTPTTPGSQLGPSSSHCPQCNAAIAADQRYCLSCGHRLSEPRVDFQRALGLESPPPPAPPRRSGWDQRIPLITLVAVAAIVLSLGVGIVIGRGNRPSGSAEKPTIVTVAGGPATTPAAASTPAATAQPVATISEDWPSGTSAWTVELSSLEESGAQASDVQAAKTAATARGATAVGVLDGDKHSGTPVGKYVIYSGQFASHKQAQAAQAKLRKNFPGALVLHVTPKGSGSSAAASSGKSSSASVSKLQGLSGSAYEQASKKLPSQIGTGGSPPPTDSKAPGAGGSGTCIGC